MVSKNTLFSGDRCRQNTLIDKRLRLSNQGRVQKLFANQLLKVKFLKGSFTTVLFVLLGMFFSISQVSATCNPFCGQTFTVNLSSAPNGTISLPPQDFYSGNCGSVSIIPSAVDCGDIGIVTLAIMSDGVTQCVGNEIKINVIDNLAPAITCPADLTVDCEDLPADTSATIAGSGVATAIDNCLSPSDFTISYSDNTVPSTSKGVCTVIERTWSVVENMNPNTPNTCIQEITIEDTDNPTLDFSNFPGGVAPADMTVACIDMVPDFGSLPAISGADNCGSLNLMVEDDTIGRGTDESACAYYDFIIERTWTASDGCNNSDSYTQTFTVKDDIDPVFTPASGTTIFVNTPSSSCTGSVTVMDMTNDPTDCAVNQLVGFFEVRLKLDNSLVRDGAGLNANGTYDAGIYDFKFTVIDPCGNNSSVTHVVEVKDLTPPVADCEGDVSNPVIILVRSDIDETDIDPVLIDDDSYDACSTISLSVNPNTVDCSDIGVMPNPIELTVTDANNNVKTCTTYLDVRPSVPTAICSAISVDLDNNGEYTLDSDDEYALGRMFRDTCYGSDNMSFSASPSTFDCGDIGRKTVIVTGTSSGVSALSSSCSATVTVNDNLAPTPTCHQSSYTAYLNDAGRVELEGAWLLEATNSAPNGNADINTMILVGGNNNSGSSGYVEYRLNAEEAVNFDFSWVYSTDDTRGSKRDLLRYEAPGVMGWDTLTQTNNSPISVSLQKGDLFKIQLETTDNRRGRATATLLFSQNLSSQDALNVSKWEKTVMNSDGKAEFVTDTYADLDNCSSPFDVTLSVSPSVLTCDSSNQVVTVTATDSQGNAGDCQVFVQLEDKNAPDFECRDFTAQLGTYNQNFGTAMVRVEAPWLLSGDRSIFMRSYGYFGNPGKDSTMYSVTSKSNISYSFDWRVASDDSLIVNEVFGYVKNGVFTQLNSDPDPKNVNTDGTETVILAVGDVFEFKLLSNGDDLRSKVYIDNISVPFTGDFDPVKWSRLDHQQYDFNRVFIHGEVSDGCIDVSNFTFEMTDLNGGASFMSEFYCWQIVDYLSTLTVSDNQGNVDMCTATVSIVDNIAPVAGCPLGFSKNLDQDGFYILKDNNQLWNQVAQLSEDNCGLNEIIFQPDTLDCTNVGFNSIIVTIKDFSGNAATCNFDINIQENTAPQIICPSDILNVDCSTLMQDTAFVNLGADTATATDNCTMSAFAYSDMLSTQSSAGCYDIIRTWTATDANSNTSSCDQTITVYDNTILTITPRPANVDRTVICEDKVPNVVHPALPAGCGVVMTYDTLDSRIDTINGVDTFYFEPGDFDYHNFQVTRQWTATNGCGQTDVLVQTIEVRDTRRPIITLANTREVANDAGVCSAVVDLELTDSDVSDCVEFKHLTITNNSPYATSSGADASGNYPLGTTTVQFSVEDLNNNIRTLDVDVIVRDAETPSMNCASDHTITVNLSSAGIGNLSVLQVDKGSFDPCGLDSLYITPNTFDCADAAAGSAVVTLTAIDAANNKGTCTTIVDVDQGQAGGSALNINCPSDATISCEESILPVNTGMAVYTTGCGMADLTYDDDKLNQVTCGIITRTWTVSIANGTVFETCDQLITVEDNSAPTIVMTTVPNDTIVDCAPHSAPDIMADDNCLGMFAVSGKDTIVASTYSTNPLDAAHYNYDIERTWTASDTCGGTAVIVRMVTVKDTKRPEIDFPTSIEIPTDLDLCSAQLSLDLATLNDGTNNYINDDCASNTNLTYSIDGVSGNSLISGTYNEGTHQFAIVVEDPSGNSNTATLTIVVADEQGPSAVCAQNEVIVLPPNGGSATVDVTRINGGSTDNCTANADLDLSIDKTTFGPSDIGPIAIILTVKDESGNENTCTSNATVIGGAIFFAPTFALTEGATGELLPLTVGNFEEVTSFSINVDVADETVLSVTDLINIHPDLTSKGTFTSSLNSGGNGYVILWSATDPNDPISPTTGTKLFDIEVDVDGVDGEMSAVTITGDAVNKLIGGTPTPAASSGVDGVVTVVSATSIYTLSGTITTPLDDAINGVIVGLSGASTGSMVTAAAGTYSFTAAGGSNAVLEPTKNTGWKEGVTIADAIIALQYPAHGAFASGYKVIAADANKSNSITGHDAIQIFQLAIDPAFTSIPGNQSWRFVTANPDLSTNNNPFGLPLAFSEIEDIAAVTANTTVDFIGMKVGDLNDDVDPQLRSGAFEFGLTKQSIENAGERIEIPFTAKGFTALNGIQSTFEFESKMMKFVEAIPGDLPNMTSFNFKDALAANGQLTFGWMNMESVDLQDGEVVFTLVFETLKGGFEIENVLKASAAIIPMEVVAETSVVSDVIELVFESSVSSTGNIATTEFGLRQNTPNPFKNETIIGFTLPNASTGQINFMDVSGKLLHSIEGNFTEGYNEVTVQKYALPTTGVVFYHLNTNFGSLVKKMIILE